MSAINQSVDIEWRGITYRAVLTFGVIELIEQDFNIVNLDIEIANNIADCEKIAVMFSHILNSAGANVTAGEVGAGMFGSGNDKNKHDATVALTKRILKLIFPERKKKKLKKDGPNEVLLTYPWEEFYKRLVAIEGISPSDFWKMTPVEAFLIIDTKEPEEKIGAFTVDEFEDLAKQYEELNNV